MEIHGLIGGKKFSMSNLSDKLRYVTRNSSLKDKHATILKVVRGAQSAIRGGKFNASAAISKLKFADKDMSSEELHNIEGIFKQLSSVPKEETAKEVTKKETSLQRAVAAAEKKKEAKIDEMNKHLLVRVNRDRSGYLDSKTGTNHGTGLASGSVPTSEHYNAGANTGEKSGKSADKSAAPAHMQF